jgi:hypothetical protein
MFSKHFKGFGSGFVDIYAKLDADTLFNLASIADKTKYKVERALVYKQLVITGRCHVEERCNGLAEVRPWPPY